MKLKPELFLKILEWVEENLPNESNLIYDSRDIVIPPYTRIEISLHVDLLIETGYIKTYSDGICISRLSMQGYNLLEVTKNDTIWLKIKQSLSRLGTQALPALIEIAAEVIKKNV